MKPIYEKITNMLKEYELKYDEYDHKPIVSYEDAEEAKLQHGWEGTESKNVFMKGKSGTYYIFVTMQGERVDFGRMKELTGDKMSIGSAEDLIAETDFVPGCVCPFGYKEEIVIIVDTRVFAVDSFLFSPGLEEKTLNVHMGGDKFRKLFENLPNRVIFAD